MKLVCRYFSVSGASWAIVGKQSAKLSYEMDLRVFERAEVQRVLKAAARGPGVDAVGGAGGGDCEGSRSADGIVLAIQFSSMEKRCAGGREYLRADVLKADVVVYAISRQGVETVTCTQALERQQSGDCSVRMINSMVKLITTELLRKYVIRLTLRYARQWAISIRYYVFIE